jgi:hypothetical protein
MNRKLQKSSNYFIQTYEMDVEVCLHFIMVLFCIIIWHLSNPLLIYKKIFYQYWLEINLYIDIIIVSKKKLFIIKYNTTIVKSNIVFDNKVLRGITSFITSKAVIIKSCLRFKPFRKIFRVVVKFHV